MGWDVDGFGRRVGMVGKGDLVRSVGMIPQNCISPYLVACIGL